MYTRTDDSLHVLKESGVADLDLGERELVLRELDVVCAPTSGLSGRRAELLRFLVDQKLAGVTLKRKQIVEGFLKSKADAVNLASVGNKLTDLRKELVVYNEKHRATAHVFFWLPNGSNIAWKLELSSNAAGDIRVADVARPIATRAPELRPTQICPLVDTLQRAGLQNAFRIKKQNDARVRRVTELIEAECKRKHPQFRLVASSGHSYLPPVGTVWAEAGLAQAVCQRGASFDVILESPFSDFAECRALANGLNEHHWTHKVNVPALRRLIADQRQASIFVTEIPVNCSLFFTSTSVFYDPYLWGRPTKALPNENNFWVFEFLQTDDEYGCYDLLRRHYEFVLQHSVSFEQFWLNRGSFDRRTGAFERRMADRFRKDRRPSGRRKKR